jgi:sortase A
LSLLEGLDGWGPEAFDARTPGGDPLSEERKKNGKKRFVWRAATGSLIIILGLFIAIYPFAKSAFYEYKKDKLLKDWGAYVLLNGPGGQQISAGAEIASPVPDPFKRPTFTKVGEDGVIEEDTQPSFDEGAMLADMLGVITIDKINLRSPILSGDSAANLDLGICVVKGSPEMGQMGNYILAGHKSRIYGRHFSRLSELAKGDIVLLSNGMETFRYEVVEKLKVTADDVWVLQNTPNERLLTLITCDYTQNPIGRLIVKAKPADATA